HRHRRAPARSNPRRQPRSCRASSSLSMADSSVPKGGDRAGHHDTRSRQSRVEGARGRVGMSKRRLIAIGALASAVLVASMLAAGVGSAHPGKAAAGSKVYLIPKFIGVPVFTQNNLGAQAAAKTLGDTVTYNGPTSADATQQVTFIDTAIQQG